MAQLSIIKKMSRQVSPGSAGDYKKDEQAGVTWLSWPHSSRRAGRCHAAQLAIIKKMSRQVSRDSAVDYQKNEQSGVTWLSWAHSNRRAGRCHAAQLAVIKKMSRQVSRDSAVDYQRSFPTRDRTPASCGGSVESDLLGDRESSLLDSFYR